MNCKTAKLTPDQVGLDKAAGILRAGGLVAFPTETVYGLGADARQSQAVAAVYTAKNRPEFNPLIVHVADLATAKEYCIFNDTALKLAAAFWPGPLSLVLPLNPQGGLCSLVTAGLKTVAIRVPAHPVAQQLLQGFGGPVAAPSANMSGCVSPTSAPHVLDGLNGRIEAVVMAEECTVGLESTILAVTETGVDILRAGGVAVEDINAVLGFEVAENETPSAPNSPGQLSSHYATGALIRLNAAQADQNEYLLGFGDQPDATLNLSPGGDLVEAAANLFAFLRQIDEIATAKGNCIAVSPIPMHGLGLAINDRLTRAAAPRD